MTHTALARKYRPTRFADLVAQQHVAAGLAGAVAKGRVANAYLLTGPRGVGKTSAARILAMALNCENQGAAPRPGEPCGRCEACRRIWSGAANLDVVEIDAASNRGVDDARELRERAMYAASVPTGYKVYIVDEAHMLTREAWNALLKILEEPPPRVVFVFATTEPQKIANTAAPVMSRVQRFDFRRIGPHEIEMRLRQVAELEGIALDDDAVLLIARAAEGGLRDALSVLDQTLAFGDGAVSASRVREALGLIDDELYAELLDLVAERRTQDVFPFVARLADAGADLVEFVSGAGEMLRALMVQGLGGQPEGMTDALRGAIKRHADRFAPGDMLRMLKLLADAESAIRRSPNVRLHVETLVLHWTLLDRTVELADVMNALSNSPRPVASPPTTTSTPPEIAPIGAVSSPGTLSLAEIESRWPAVLEAVGAKRRLLKEALTHAKPIAVEASEVVLEIADREVHLEGLERGRAIVEEEMSQVFGVETVRLKYQTGLKPSVVQPPDPPQRLNRDADQAERLKHYRKMDPALDAMAEALDLEVFE